MNSLITVSVQPNSLTTPDQVREIGELLEIAVTMPPIADEETNAEVNALMARATVLSKEVESIRKTIKAPVDALVKAIQAEANKVAEPAEQIISACKRAQAVWVMECQRQAAEAARKNALAEEAAKDAQTDDRPTAPLVTPEYEVVAPDVRTRWHEDVEVVDKEQIPEKYWILDMNALRNDVVVKGYVVAGAKKTRVPKIINGSYLRKGQ